MQFIADSVMFSSHLSDPLDARGQAIGLSGQTLAQCVSTGGLDEAFIALSAALFVALCGVLLFRYAKRQVSQPVYTVRAATARGSSLAAMARCRFRWSGLPRGTHQPDSPPFS
jgi:hypothetical protein